MGDGEKMSVTAAEYPPGSIPAGAWG